MHRARHALPSFLAPAVAGGVALLGMALGVGLAGPSAAAAQEPTTRELNLLAWQEVAELVPARIETVLIPTGTLEPHGVLPNGSDNLAPEAMARALAPRLDALVAPTLNYGVNGSLDEYPGTFSVGEATYEALVEDILAGLARSGFLNLVVINGHGGPQTAILERVAARVGREHRVRTLVTNWWSATSEVTFEVFGEDGGHAGSNESAYVQAVVPEHVHPERYAADLARHRTPGVSAWPFPWPIVLYQEGQGYPDFDPGTAQLYFERVNERMAELIGETIAAWDRVGLFR